MRTLPKHLKREIMFDSTGLILSILFVVGIIPSLFILFLFIVYLFNENGFFNFLLLLIPFIVSFLPKLILSRAKTNRLLYEKGVFATGVFDGEDAWNKHDYYLYFKFTAEDGLEYRNCTTIPKMGIFQGSNSLYKKLTHHREQEILYLPTNPNNSIAINGINHNIKQWLLKNK